MKLIVKSIAFAGALCVLAGTAQAADGIADRAEDDRGRRRAADHQVQIDAKRMRAETSDPSGGKPSSCSTARRR